MSTPAGRFHPRALIHGGYHWALVSFTIVALTALTLGGCRPKVEPYSTLANKGIVPLSGVNPNVGSNLFIAREAERSSVLYGFLRGRGAPRALELLSNDFEPLKAFFYYPREREYYVAELEQRDKYYEWITRGPYRIERRLLREFSALREGTDREPVFVIEGRMMRFKEIESAPPRIVAPPIPMPTVTPTPRPRPARPKATPIPQGTPAPGIVVKPTSDDPLEGKLINSDLLAIIVSQGFADRELNGDLVHSVIEDGEPIARIAKWYTGTEANAKVLAEASGIPVDKPLIKGQKILVPRPLLKRFRPMTSDFQ